MKPMIDLTLFFYTANERNRIYTLKELGLKKPWTNDEVFMDSYFCNVFRNYDKVSKYIINNLINLHPYHPQLWASIVMTRMISRLETLKKLKENNALIGDYKKAYAVLKEMKDNKESVFTGAFIVNSSVGNGVWMDKLSYLFFLLDYFNKLRIDGDTLDTWLRNNKSLEDAFLVFKKAPGVANFMAYQYMVDLTYSDYLKENIDDEVWVKLGLGAVRGMNRLLTGEPSSAKIKNELFLSQYILQNWKIWVNNTLESEIDKTWEIAKLERPELKRTEVAYEYWKFKQLKLQDVEHWLCEYDKYCRGGSKKRKYNGRS